MGGGGSWSGVGWMGVYVSLFTIFVDYWGLYVYVISWNSSPP